MSVDIEMWCRMTWMRMFVFKWSTKFWISDVVKLLTCLWKLFKFQYKLICEIDRKSTEIVLRVS